MGTMVASRCGPESQRLFHTPPFTNTPNETPSIKYSELCLATQPATHSIKKTTRHLHAVERGGEEGKGGTITPPLSQVVGLGQDQSNRPKRQLEGTKFRQTGEVGANDSPCALSLFNRQKGGGGHGKSNRPRSHS